MSKKKATRMPSRVLNPYMEVDRNTRPAIGPLPERILLLAALVALAALPAFIYITGTDVLYIHFWVYIAAVAAIPILFLAALTMKLYRSIAKRIARLIVLWGMIAVILFIGSLAYSFSFTYDTYGENPVSYYTHPETGRRIVILKCSDLEMPVEGTDSYVSLYRACPMRNNSFFYAGRGTESVHTKTGVDFVEWAEDGSCAFVHITDLDGVEQVLTCSLEEPVIEETVTDSAEAETADGDAAASESAE